MTADGLTGGVKGLRRWIYGAIDRSTVRLVGATITPCIQPIWGLW